MLHNNSSCTPVFCDFSKIHSVNLPEGTTNNAAEFHWAALALEDAIAQHHSRITLIPDSLMLAQFLKGNNSIASDRTELVMLAKKIRSLANCIDYINVAHVKAHCCFTIENETADALATLARKSIANGAQRMRLESFKFDNFQKFDTINSES